MPTSLIDAVCTFACITGCFHWTITRLQGVRPLLPHPQFTLPVTADYSALDPALVPPLEQLALAGERGV